MKLCRFTTDAKQDLYEIREYTKANWDDIQSRNYLIELRDTIRLLQDNPLLGVQRRDIAEGLYSFPHGSHVIYYMPNEGELIITGVLHKSMVPENHLSNRTI